MTDVKPKPVLPVTCKTCGHVANAMEGVCWNCGNITPAVKR